MHVADHISNAFAPTNYAIDIIFIFTKYKIVYL